MNIIQHLIKSYSRHKNLEVRKALRVNKTFREGNALIQEELWNNYSSLVENSHPVKAVVIEYLVERISHSAGQAVFLHGKYPAHSHSVGGRGQALISD